MAENLIKAPAAESDRAVEGFLASTVTASVKFADMPYKYMQVMQELATLLYNQAYVMGYNQRMIDESLKLPDNG